MAIGSDEILKGLGASVVAFYLLRKLAKDIGKEADRIGQRTMEGCGKQVEAFTSVAVSAMSQEAERILDQAGDRLHGSVEELASTGRLNCMLQGGKLLCEVEPKELSQAGFLRSLSNK